MSDDNKVMNVAELRKLALRVRRIHDNGKATDADAAGLAAWVLHLDEFLRMGMNLPRAWEYPEGAPESSCADASGTNRLTVREILTGYISPTEAALTSYVQTGEITCKTRLVDQVERATYFADSDREKARMALALKYVKAAYGDSCECDECKEYEANM